MNLKILVIGPGGCGKDVAAEFISQLSGIPLIGSTSWFMKTFVASRLGISEQRAWDTRRENRTEWRQIIDDYRKNDPGRIVREMLAGRASGIITGIRPRAEYEASRRFFDTVIWIERPGVEVDTTLELSKDDADIIVNNHGTLYDLSKALSVIVDCSFTAEPWTILTTADFENCVGNTQKR